MQLNMDDLAACAGGCVDLTRREGAVHFVRIVGPLAEFYRQTEGGRIRLESPSAVRLRFRTGARALRLSLRYGGAARPVYRGVVCVDGTEDREFGPADRVDEWEGEVEIPGGHSIKTVEVWMPHLVVTGLKSVELVEGELIPVSEPEAPRWLVLGDSIAQGMTAPLPTESYVAIVARELGWSVRNFGVGGATFSEPLAEADIDWDYDILSVAYGVNDFNRGISRDECAANAERLLSRQRETHPNADIVLMTPTPWVRNREPNDLDLFLEDYRETLRRVAEECPGCVVLEGPQLIPAEARYFVDGVHPNAAGMAVCAENLVKAFDDLPSPGVAPGA